MKRFISAIASTLLGDCNGDEFFDIADVTAMKKWISGSGELELWENADLNKDGFADIYDFQIMRQAMAESL